MSATPQQPHVGCARRGAEFLDAKLGRGWRRKIKRRELNMGVGWYEPGACGCVLAQLYDRYIDGAEAVGLDDPYGMEAAALGFHTDKAGNYGELTQAWLEVLREKAHA